jgi:hypothetical protein
MSEKRLKYESVDISTKELTSAWSAIVPGDGKLVLRATGSFQVASAAAPGSEFITIPSGIGFDYEGQATIYASSPKNAVLQIMKYS